MRSVWLALVKLSIVSARSSFLPRSRRACRRSARSRRAGAGDHDGDAELVADPRDEFEHRVPPGRVEAVRRLVEQQQPRVADQGLASFTRCFMPVE